VVLVLSAALVQGEGAPDSLVAAIDRIEKDPRVEVLIIGRGGGSDEDLMAFNDERVVRRLAALALPTVSAVGHEVDTTLTDLVADVRAATPSQAAELVVPELEPRLTRLRRDRRQLVRAMRTRLAEDAAHAHSLRARLSDPRFVVAQRQQDLDDFCMRAERAMRGRVTGLSERARALRSRLLARHPRLVVMGSRSSLEPLRARLRVAVRDRMRGADSAREAQVPALSNAMRRRLQDERNQLKSTTGRLEALSPLTVLGRGYSIVMTETGSAITEASQVQAGDPVVVRLHRGALTATVRTSSAGSDGGSRRGEA
jgi:exodeoxyribonuclease VII large subunit